MNDPEEVSLDRTVYTRRMTDEILDLYYRDSPRETPFPIIAEKVGVTNLKGLSDLIYTMSTGYSHNKVEGTKKRVRRDYRPTRYREDHSGRKWYPREDHALKLGMDPKGAGQTLRVPPCDIPFMAVILARSEAEVAARWEKLKNPLGLDGFGMGKK